MLEKKIVISSTKSAVCCLCVDPDHWQLLWKRMNVIL